MVLPRANLEQTPLGTGIEGFARRLVQRWKAILPDENHAIASVHSFSHNLFLARGDSCTHQYAACLTARQPFLPIVGIILIGIGTMDDDRDLLRDVKQKAVAHQLAMPLADVGVVQGGEEVGVLPLDGQAAGVVIKVVLPVVELPVIEENQVIIASLEEGGKTRSRTRS